MLTIELIAIFAFCMIGTGLSSFFLGRKEGMEALIEHFIDEGILEDLSQTTGSNDLADMLDQDYEDTQGGDLEENPDNLLEGLAVLLHHIPKITKALNQ